MKPEGNSYSVTAREKLSELISTMNLPDCNRDLNVVRNVLWLDRNMFIYNGNHPCFQEANVILKQLCHEVRSAK